ncbi:MAG: DUF2914 domain-containing protein [Gammaproteobacteria bacterium]
MAFVSAPMSEKKLVIKLKYGASARSETGSSSSGSARYDWNYARIAWLLLLVFITIGFIAYQLFSAVQEQNGTARSPGVKPPIIAQKSLNSPASESSEIPPGAAQFELNRPSDALRTVDNPADHPPSTATESHSGSSRGEGMQSEESTQPENSVEDAAVESHAQQAETGLAPSQNIVRAQFSWGILNREPTGTVVSPAILQPGGSVTLYFFSEFRNLKDRTVTHVWSHNGRHVGSMNFRIGGNRWRVFSTKQLHSGLLGEWRVRILDAAGKPLGEYSLNVLQPG